MPTILEYLSSPSWWFSAVFVAIIASIIAAFAREWIQKVAAHLSKRARARIARQNERDARRVDALAGDDTMLILYSHTVIGGLMLFVLTAMFFLMIPATAFALLQPGLRVGNAMLDLPASPLGIIVTTALAGAQAIGIGVVTVQRQRILNRARAARARRRQGGGIAT